MNEEELVRSLDRGVEQRVEGARLRTDVDDLLRRVERRAARGRRGRSVLVVVFLFVGGLAGYAIGRDDSASAPAPIAVVSDGINDRSEPTALEPADVEAARVAVENAFLSAYTGSVPAEERLDAIQNGPALEALRKDAVAVANARGLPAEQLAGTTIEVSGVTFIDADHAAVRFTFSVPGVGDVLKDRIGYAVRVDGRWQVALRTACDLLSLSGSILPCPPA